MFNTTYALLQGDFSFVPENRDINRGFKWFWVKCNTVTWTVELANLVLDAYDKVIQ